jgi:hypothetical protein
MAESKFLLKRDELVNKLRVCSMALATQPVVQIHQHFVFDGTTVSAYDDNLAILTPCKAGPFAIHGPTLLGLLEASAGDDAGLAPDETHITIRTGRSTFKLPYLTEDAFLFEPPEEEWSYETAISENLLNGFRAALLTVSNDLSKPAMMGVCLLRDAKHTALYSCDGDGMTKVPLGKGGDELWLMMPSRFCETILKVMEGTDAEKGVLRANAEWVNASFNNGYEVYGRLIEVTTRLGYEELVTDTLKKQKTVYLKVPEGLGAGLVRAQVITKFQTVPTTLTVEGDPSRLKLLTENSVGTVRDSFQFQGHPEVQANVSAELTGRAIKLCPEMAVHANCVAYRHPDTGLFVLMSNMDK